MTTGKDAGHTTTTSRHFLNNVLWNWAGTGVSLFSAFILTPVMIRHLGEQGYGVWGLAFSLIEYYWLMDLGFRSATIKYSAQYRALQQPKNLNQLINTGMAYYSGVAAVVIAGAFLILPFLDRLFPLIPGALRSDFRFLILIIGMSWSIGAVFIVFQAGLEGFQRFDLVSRILIVTTTLRAAGLAALLWKGYGLVAIGVFVVITQVVGYLASFICFRRIFPELRFSPSLISWERGREMAAYGVHTFIGTIAGQLLNQTAPLLIGRYLPPAFFGYYTVPLRLLTYAGGELAARVAVVTGAKSAELAAFENNDAIARMAALVNRYCLALFMPFALVLLVYGVDILRLWISPPSVGAAYARNSGPLLLPFVLGTGLAIVGQFNSSSVLYGMARHQRVALALLIEGIVGAVAAFFVVRAYGILAVAWISAGLMIVNRGLFISWLLCREIRISWPRFLTSIYLRPILAALPAYLLGLWLKTGLLPGQSWLEVIAASAVMGCVYAGPAILLCVDPHHRSAALAFVRRRLGA